MNCKKACLVINPRAGQNIAQLTAVISILSAAGWKTDIVLKEYGGHTLELATSAAKAEYDLIIGYGGDGTFNQVVNGVMQAKSQHSMVGLIPGGTANVWASEFGIPTDSVKAALSLVNSESRKVDIGHVEVESIILPAESQVQPQAPAANGKEKSHKKAKLKTKVQQHFVLMAGLGIDAAIMDHVSKQLKYQLGPLAVGVSAAKELPTQHPFPIELRSFDAGQNGRLLWQGEALQVVIGNTRRYGDITEMTPNAYIDDGVLDICVIVAGDPLGTMQQVMSLLLRRKPDNTTAETFRAAHLSLTVPASIQMQLDGSTVKLKDYLRKSDWEALQRANNAEKVMVTYRFDSMPRALRVAVPRTYDNTLFEGEDTRPSAQTGEDAASSTKSSEQPLQISAAEQQKTLEQIHAFLDSGREVKVLSVSPNPAKKETYILAGTTPKRSTGEDKPVAVSIDERTTIIERTGEHLPPAAVQKLQEGGLIVVEGKQSKRGVIRATRLVIV